ncbi:MAG TPA: hypothetical protein VIX82_01540 [Solirubrobacteraceae bacterium]
MGLLDEAIREHLDLKRRRGADPNEIERAEREALGPVRRQPEGIDPAQPGLAAPDREHEAGAGQYQTPEPLAESDEHYAAGVEAESDHSAGRPEAEPDHYAGRPEADPEQYAAPVEAKPEHYAAPVEAEPEQRLVDEPSQTPPPVPGVPPAPSRASGPETVEYDVEQEHREGEHREAQQREPEAGEELLEETPEFLQDTPDHDRLWFEQRPPKDFDFEK